MPATSRRRRPRHVHLGERLTVIERIRHGRHTPEEAAAEIGVPVEEVLRWIEVHAEDRIMDIEEVAQPAQVRDLTRRAQMLMDMIGNADEEIRGLVRQLTQK